MNDVKSDITALQDVGSNLRKLGIYKIIEFGLIFIVIIGMVISFFSSINPTTTEDQFFDLLFSRIRLGILLLYMVSAVELIFVYMVATHLAKIKADNYDHTTKQYTYYLFLAFIGGSILSFILGWIFIDQLLNGIQSRISLGSGAILTYLEQIESGTWISQLMSIVNSLIQLAAMHFLYEYVSYLGQKLSDPYIGPTKDKLNILRIGAGLVFLGSLLTILAPTIPFVGFLSSGGSIMVIVGLISAGGNLSNVGTQSDYLNNAAWSKYTATPGPAIDTTPVTDNEEPMKGEPSLQFCHECGGENRKSSNFCFHCGTNLRSTSQ